MENVSKALMIAGGVLIGILVTTLLLVGLSRMRHYQEVQESSKKNEQLSEFNSQFESYNKQVITGYELISIAHMTNDTNNRYVSSEGYKEVKVYVKPKSSDPSNSTLGGFVKDGKKEGGYFSLTEYGEYFDDKLSDNVQVQYNQKKKLKEAYFKCSKIEYDDDKKSGSGRVIGMWFDELTKKNN